VLVDLHDRGLVAATVAVVRSREDRHDVLLVAPVVALHHQLMRARDQRQTVVVIELLGNVLTECVTGTTRRDTPTTAIVRIGPEEIALERGGEERERTKTRMRNPNSD
jgi:hypothetical protein